VAIDTEWFGMDGKRLHRPHGAFACATFSYDGRVVYVVTDAKDLPQAMKNVEPAVHVYHNAKFDIGQIRRFVEYPHRDRMWDTMLVEQIRFSGYYAEDQFALKDLVRRYLHLYMSKEERAEFGKTNVMTNEMLIYSALDCALTYRVFDQQRREIDKNDLWIWKNVECLFTFVLLAMGGMRLDTEQWMELARRHQSIADTIQAKYGSKSLVIGPRGGHKDVWTGINLASTEQVKAEIKRLGYKVESSNEDDIKHLAGECEFIRDVLEFREHDKAASTYGESMLAFVEKDGYIYPDIRQMGAGTGRPSMRKPNGQNIPRDKEHRACFVGNLVDGDWSAQEPRIFAYLCQDPTMIQIYKEKKDIYIEFARLGFGEIITKADKARRGEMKIVVLGACYGLTEYGIFRQHGIPLEQGKMLMDTFWRTFPKAKEYKNHVIEQGRKDGYVETIYKRKYWLNTYQWGWQNNCLNSPVQGSAADAMKLACIAFQNEWGWPDGGLTSDDGFRYSVSPIHNIIHDEILLDMVDTPELMDAAEQLMRTVMIATAEKMHPGIPAEVEIGQGTSWATAHG
jgi:DNA polymerase I-like protein with 3'-5' exonuclease and polymerase domains